MNNQEIKRDAGKPMMCLLPPEALEALGAVLTFGAEKYSANSWRQVEKERYVSALLRHMCKYMKDPKSVDEESGLPHIWHVLCNAAFLTALEDKQEAGK